MTDVMIKSSGKVLLAICLSF